MKKLSGNFRAALVTIFKENHIPIQRSAALNVWQLFRPQEHPE